MGISKNWSFSLIPIQFLALQATKHAFFSESSWAYENRPGPLFRSTGGEGITPMFGVDKKLDAEQIFKDVMKKKQEGRQASDG